MTAHLRRFLPLALALLALALLAPVAEAARLRLRLPGPGQTTVSVAQLRYRGKPPRHIDLRLKNRSRLGPAYRGLYAVYSKRRGRTTTVTFVTLILRQKRHAARQSAVAGTSTVRDLGLTMLFLLSGEYGDGFFEAGEDEESGGFAEDDMVAVRHVTELIGPKHPTRPRSTLNDLFKDGGVEIPPAEKPADLGANVIDTGHYDDGHSFGWKSAGTKKGAGRLAPPGREQRALRRADRTDRARHPRRPRRRW